MRRMERMRLSLLALACVLVVTVAALPPVVNALPSTRPMAPLRIDAQESWPQPTRDCARATCVIISWTEADRHRDADTQDEQEQEAQPRAHARPRCASPMFTLFAQDANTAHPVVLCTATEQQCMVVRSMLPTVAAAAVVSSSSASLDLSLQVLAECRDDVLSGIRWLPSLSPLAPFSISSGADPSEAAWTAAPAGPGVATLSRLREDDTAVRVSLCTLFNETNGASSWVRSDGWCDPMVPLCKWFGVQCSPDADGGSIVTGLLLPDNHLTSVRIAGVPEPFSNGVFTHLSSLLQLNFGNNPDLTLPVPLDLSPLTHLRSLNLSGVASVLAMFRIPTHTTGEGWGLEVLDVSYSNVMMPFSLLPNLRELYADKTSAVLDFGQIHLSPRLRVFRACDARMTTQPERCGGITLAIFARLADTNPELEVLSIGSNALEFNVNGTAVVGVSNFPVVRAPKLRVFNISNSPALHCGRDGPPGEWLSGMPLLEELYLDNLQGTQAFGTGSSPSPYSPSAAAPFDALAVFNTSALHYGSRRLRVLSLSNTAVVGSLSPLHALGSLEHLDLDNTGVADVLPTSIAALWPNLTHFSICCNGMHGSVPSFAHLPQLRYLGLQNNAQLGGPVHDQFLHRSDRLVHLDLSDNSMTGPLPSLSDYAHLRYVYMCNNEWEDSFPSWRLPSLQRLSISHNKLAGEFPRDFWDSHPRLNYLDLRSNFITGTIPPSAVPRWFELFCLTDNRFTGPLPENITAQGYEVSYNSMSGPVSLFDLPGYPPTNSLCIGFQIRADSSNAGFTCPIRLESLTALTRLDLPRAGFTGCDYTDKEQVALPHDSLLYLDISDNAWRPMSLPLEQSQLQVLKANNASIHSLGVIAGALSLRTLVLSRNPFQQGVYNAKGNSNPLASLFASCPYLGFFYCASCNLKMTIMHLIEDVNVLQNQQLFELSVPDNELFGTLSPSLLLHYSPLHSLPLSIRLLSIAGNRGVSGVLPEASSGYSDAEYMDFSGTDLTGPIPASWGSLLNLQRLALHDTKVQCSMAIGPDGRWHCEFPSWISVSQSSSASSAVGDSVDGGYTCPSLTLSQNYSALSISEDYHLRTLCKCDPKYLGINGMCVRCPTGCTCVDDVVQDCYPVLAAGIDVEEPEGVGGRGRGRAASDVAVSVGSIAVSAILSCPLTVTGRSLCNPHGRPWPGFNVSAPQLDLSEWCYTGHTDRLCSKCATGFFSSGRWCLQCVSGAGHAFIIVANLGLFLLLVAYLYARAPSVQASLLAVGKYHRSLVRERQREAEAINDVTPLDESSDLARLSSASWAGDKSIIGAGGSSGGFSSGGGGSTVGLPHGASGVLLSSASSFTSNHSITLASSASAVVSSGPGGGGGGGGAGPQQESASSVEAAQQANPLRLLVFHGQQLSILLLTTTSLPPVLAGFMSVISSGSGFSLSSVLALECLTERWNLVHQCWAALVAPAAVAAFAAAVYTVDRYKQRRAAQVAGVSPLEWSSSAAANRWYGVCISLLYVFCFPCAQTALAAVACTDFREYDPPASTAGAGPAGSRIPLPTDPSRIYLNLYPWQQCDAAWRSDLLPPAALGILVWFVLFPVGSTLLFRRLRHRLHARADSSVWPLCADLLRPYKRRYWYWEQVLLLRRLALVACVTLIPATSLYLPIALFALIQQSALVQHVAQPFESQWLNRGELASLYLLLMNYITALVLHETIATGAYAPPTGSDQPGDSQLNVWTVMLFALNLAFILLLGLLLFRTLQLVWPVLSQRAITAFPALGRCCCRTRAKRKQSKAQSMRTHAQQRHHTRGKDEPLLPPIFDDGGDPQQQHGAIAPAASPSPASDSSHLPRTFSSHSAGRAHSRSPSAALDHALDRLPNSTQLQVISPLRAPLLTSSEQYEVQWRSDEL